MKAKTTSGLRFKDTTVESRKIKNTIFHPEYTFPESYFDIAIATLNEAVPKAAFKTIRPICLPSRPIQNKGY